MRSETRPTPAARARRGPRLRGGQGSVRADSNNGTYKFNGQHTTCIPRTRYDAVTPDLFIHQGEHLTRRPKTATAERCEVHGRADAVKTDSTF